MFLQKWKGACQKSADEENFSLLTPASIAAVRSFFGGIDI
jgi:hypothetical protein